MDASLFDEQIKRLQSQWPTGFGSERKKELWRVFKDVPNFDFRDAVSYLLLSCRSCPLVDEIDKAVERAKLNYFQQKKMEEAKYSSVLDSLNQNGRWADKEFVAKCEELYESLRLKKITLEQFYQGCDLLDQASKMFGKKPITVLPQKYLTPVHEEDKPY